MIRLKYKQKLVLLGKRSTSLLIAVILSLSTLIVSLNYQEVNAAQVVNRSVTISTSRSDATSVSYDFDFDTLTTETVGSIIFQFCTTPLGTCTLPNDMEVHNATISDQASWSSAFTLDTTEGDCTASGVAADTQVCLTRTAVSETLGTEQIILGGIKNPEITTPVFITVFVRMYIYNNATFTPGANNANVVHYGTMAAAIVNQLTTTGRVQERLEFCVAALTDAATIPNGCANFPSTTSVDLGIIDNLSISRSPVDNTVVNPANDSYGAAMVDTNAANGIVITFFPEEATSVLGGDTHQLRAFRVLPTDCNAVATTLTDQCFVSADYTANGGEGEDFSSGVERFGLFIPCVEALGTSETDDNLANGTIIGDMDAYNGTDDTLVSGTPAQCENIEGTGGVDENFRYAFRDDGSPSEVAKSDTVVDDEMIKIVFAATAGSTTPTGQYFVVTTWIATPTY